jgi:iron(III) transport system ATP-binding protein
MTALMQLESVAKHYDRGPVLHDITLHVEPGEFLVLIGGSGSGKTTILRTVAGLERISAGRVTLRGETMDDPAAAMFVLPEHRGLGMVFQDYALWPHLSCLENVAAALPRRVKERASLAQAMLDRMQIGSLAHRRPARLSGGQQQRVGIARALVAHPALLLLDEPFSSLDPHVRDQLRIEIRALARENGTAALLVSHDPADIWRMADRVVVLEEGRITQDAAPQTLFNAPASPHVARFSGAQGGFPVRAARAEGQTGILLGDAFIPARTERFVPGTELLAYIRPQDVQTASSDGIPASLAHCVFEAGAWLAHWRIEGLASLLCSREAAPPPSAARLSVQPDKIFLYPKDTNEDVA